MCEYIYNSYNLHKTESSPKTSKAFLQETDDAISVVGLNVSEQNQLGPLCDLLHFTERTGLQQGKNKYTTRLILLNTHKHPPCHCDMGHGNNSTALLACDCIIVSNESISHVCVCVSRHVVIAGKTSSTQRRMVRTTSSQMESASSTAAT